MTVPTKPVRTSADLRQDIAISAATLTSPQAGSLTEVRAWLAARAGTDDVPDIERIGFSDLHQWGFHPDSGDLVHSSGKFFQITGLRLHGHQPPVDNWSQPIINQPEIGILGILVTRIDGVLCFLMQAKMEPGNINTIQLSPTVQATRSNYRRVHGGAATRFLDNFRELDESRVLVDVLQSEQGASFYQKRNRNMIVEIDEPLPTGEEYRWLTLGQIHELLHVDNAVNMNARSILSNLPVDSQGDSIGVRNWINEAKCRSDFVAELVGLRDLRSWQVSDEAIRHESGRFFEVIAVSVQARHREVRSWDQPLIAPCGQGVVAFLASRRSGQLEVLVQARAEPGTRDVLELAPTVQAVPASYEHLPREARPRYLDLVMDAPPERLLFDVLLSEEGGRFYHAEHRYLVVEADDDVRQETPPPAYRWVRLGELSALIRHSGYCNVEARSLLACLQSLR
ncbi:MAG TPA: NDP-hexose 2,3-dehydratase family protein [Pseudonocardiaceae bacterium]|nr:NDP-hexose 2,3-dehydratase family protein [Pseudonocardiaceae bacterium]